MSIARHHAEWLSLLEISGPFLSMPVLMDAFPQGLDTDDPRHAQELRAAYEEWLDNQGGLQPDPAIHRAWIHYVLENTLELPDEVLAEGQAIPAGLKAGVPEHHETLRPDLVVREPGGGRARLLMQVYPPGQDLENAIPGRPWKAGPATRMMELLHATEVRLGLVTNGEHWLLVQARRGETTGYASWYANLWVEERLTLRAFHTLLGVQRFFGVPQEESLEALLDRSAEDQHEVTDQLGSQVRHAVEILIQAIDRADQDRGRKLLADMDEKRLYEAALTVMMRLVFLLAAEERGLLLLGDPLYDQHYAVSTLRGQLREMADQHGEDVLERRYDAWSRLLATFRAVYGGVEHEDLRLPAYGGSLFDPDRFPFLEGRAQETEWRTHAADPLPVNNRTVLHLLEALQVLLVTAPGGVRAARTLSFRALDIEQIGHVYEGLLDHEAVRAAEPVVGLQGTKYKEPEIPLSELAARLEKGEKELIDYLRDQTGRTKGALRNGLHDELETNRAERLRAACGNDEELYRRVRPFAGLIRDDDYGFPVVFPANSVYVTEGPTRRQTGTHYTPRSLTEPIVQHTLEPLVYEGPAQGTPREEWRLRSPQELLDLKVCDMAMGSGAFLVQACRYLSERLVEAWDDIAAGREQGNGTLQITPEGKRATGDPAETILPQSDEERLTLARRLVVDRCLYGVDKNHLAVEMAKLSLWLVTLDKNRPFTFLNHALRHGDSLVGADDTMFLRWARSLRDSSMPLFDEEMRRLVNEAKEKRQALQAFEVRDVREAERKAQLLAEAEAATDRIKLGCDLLVGARMLEDLTKTEREALLANALIDFTAGEPFSDPVARRAVKLARDLPAFHWPFEFPEVFAEGGFSAFMGNPPFIGGKRISIALDMKYQAYLVNQIGKGVRGSADICAYFFLRAYRLTRPGGNNGLLATNTISQAGTREVALDQIVEAGATIYRAVPSREWPGKAGVKVALLWIHKGAEISGRILNGRSVPNITPFLTDAPTISGKPRRLAAMKDNAFIGTYVLGKGFVLESDEAHDLISRNAANEDVLFPYLVGRDINSRPDQSPSRWVINFFDWPIEKASQYPECLEILTERVKPYRDERVATGKQIHEYDYWKFWDKRLDSYAMIAEMPRILVCSRVSKYLNFVFAPTTWVYSEATVVVAFSAYNYFAYLQSDLHDVWARKYGSSLGNTLRYTPRSTFETFPFPPRKGEQIDALTSIANDYYVHRRSLMLEKQEGLTDTYNRFHDADETVADIDRLRELHVEMDMAVAAAYGWEDLDLGHDFHETDQGIRFTISDEARRQVLTRLLMLNHERYEEEVRQGMHERAEKKRKKKRKKAAKRKKNEGQLSLF